MAARYWLGTTSTAWGTTGNWSATSGGAGGESVPTNADDVIFDANGNNPCAVSATSRVCKTFTVDAGYTSTITHSVQLTVSGNITWHSGFTIAGTGLLIINTSATITSGTKTWPNDLTISGNIAITLVDDLTVGGLFTVNASTAITVNATTSEVVYSNGLRFAQNGNYNGNTSHYLTGGTWSHANTSSIMRRPLYIDGNVTVSGSVAFDDNTLTYISGTVTTTGSTLRLPAVSTGCTLDTDGINWDTIQIGNGNIRTYTINSLLTANTIDILNVFNRTFAGIAGWTTSILNVNGISANNVILTDGVTYTITSEFNCFVSRVGSIVLFTSSHASNKAILTLQNPAACNVLANFTRIDASNGRTIPTFNGTITDCLNIVEFHDLPTSSHAL
jgi:hypothetical protein